MANTAYEIMNAQSSQTESQAIEYSRKFKLPPLHLDVLEGFIALIYRGNFKATPEDVALTMYTACVMR